MVCCPIVGCLGTVVTGCGRGDVEGGVTMRWRAVQRFKGRLAGPVDDPRGHSGAELVGRRERVRVRVLLRESDGQLEDVGGGLVDGLGLDAHRGMVYGVEHAPVVLKELDGGPFERVPWDTRRPAVQDDLVSQDHLLDDLATTEPWSLRKGDDRDSIRAVEKSRNHPVDLEPSTPGRLG